MADQNAVSVLIPTYNPDPEFLRQALDSLKAQTFTGWTALIHDDCSSTDVQATVAPYLTDKRFTFIRSDKRLGIGGNWNACVRNSGGTFIAFLFQDDLWAPSYLAEAIRVLEENPTVGFVSLEHAYKVEGMQEAAPLYEAVRQVRLQDVQGGFHQGPALLRRWLERELTPNIIGEPSFVVMRREAVEKMGSFLTDMPQFLDVEYWTRLLLGYDWYFARGEFGGFRVHAKGASAMNQETGSGLFDRLRCFDLLIGELSGSDRRLAVEARSRALKKMIGKFFKRVGTGKKVSGQGSGELKKFCLRHPLTVCKAFVAYLAYGDK